MNTMSDRFNLTCWLAADKSSVLILVHKVSHVFCMCVQDGIEFFRCHNRANSS
jgi:hypothetical protein